MAGVILNADVREVLFTSERMPNSGARARRALQEGGGGVAVGAEGGGCGGATDLNVSVVLGHLLAATQVRWTVIFLKSIFPY